MVRTPIATAPPLLERAQQLLVGIWPRSRSQFDDGACPPRLLAIELKIGEFTKPSQLSLSDFDRLDGGGTLQGLSAERRGALVRQDEVFEARYGATAFQHVAAVDSANILTERRFRWEDGLPWNGAGSTVRKGAVAPGKQTHRKHGGAPRLSANGFGQSPRSRERCRLDRTRRSTGRADRRPDFEIVPWNTWNGGAVRRRS
jgi:hypothetical protein